MVPIMDVVIAGGGVAGLEALLALHAMARERVSLRLIAPDPEFSYRPLAVAEPFGLGHAHHVPLERFAEEAGAELIIDAAVGVDDANRQVRLRDGGAQRVARGHRWRLRREDLLGGHRAAQRRTKDVACGDQAGGAGVHDHRMNLVDGHECRNVGERRTRQAGDEPGRHDSVRLDGGKR